MAIPATPQNLDINQGNRNISINWSGVAGATSYAIQRSVDGINYSSLATSIAPSYLDTTVTIGVMYWYQVASTNVSGTSSYSSPVQMVPAPNGEMSLYELRLRSQQRADRVNSDFVIPSEWNTFINLALNELYDLLIDVYEDYFMAPRARFTVNGHDFRYPLPDGALNFNDINNQPFVAPPFYKLLGADLAVNLTAVNNAFITLDKYNLLDRNRYVYPNTSSTIYGVFNLQYRVLDNFIEFIPTPSGNQVIQLLYIPKLPKLIQDTDLTTIGGSGWLQYAIVRAAKYALDKEESDTQGLDGELIFLRGRIEESAMNRDAGRPDTISDTRKRGWGNGWGWNFPVGGW